jgi:hypothetical protein
MDSKIWERMKPELNRRQFVNLATGTVATCLLGGIVPTVDNSGLAIKAIAFDGFTRLIRDRSLFSQNSSFRAGVQSSVALGVHASSSTLAENRLWAVRRFLESDREHRGQNQITENGLKRYPRRQQFALQFLGSPWGQVATQERPDFARFRVEKLCQNLHVVTLPGQPWFQSVTILGEHISIISTPTGFWPTL